MESPAGIKIAVEGCVSADENDPGHHPVTGRVSLADPHLGAWHITRNLRFNR